MNNIPKHIAIIPDGNRRWAKLNGKSSLEGHMAGRERTIELIQKAQDLGVEVITFWGFSTDNWSRGAKEVEYLMKEIFLGGYKKYLDKMKEVSGRFIHLGRKDRIPKEVVKVLMDLEEKTKDESGLTVCFAIDYGGRDEILRMVNDLLKRDVSVEDINEEYISDTLDTAGLPDLDVIIRTSGEKRLSGFMPWQSQYAELFFVDDFYPDFTGQKLEDIVKEFGSRIRRFGGDSNLTSK